MTPSSPTPAPVRQWLAEPMPKNVGLTIDRIAKTDGVRHVAVMPDVHLANEVCNGLVVATGGRLFPQAVGSDIGCGMAALRFDGPTHVLTDEKAAARLLSGLYRAVPTTRQPKHRLGERLPEALDQTALSHPTLEGFKQRDGRVQLGTLGRGNHFVEFQEDQDGDLWLMVHSGSRAMGQAITSHHHRQAKAAATGFLFLEADGDAGQAYLRDLRWACAYAEENRRMMIAAAADVVAELFDFAADWTSLISCNHNHVRPETHFGERLWVHRKGSLFAGEGEPGIIPGSMGTTSFHVAGRGEANSLASSSHGAGRRFSRSDARRRISTKELGRQMKDVWFDQRVAAHLREESPAAYKDIHQVMRAQRELTQVVRKLRPLLVYKGT